MRDADEQILEQRARLHRMRADEAEVLRDRLERVHLHAPRDPAQDGRAFVMGEIVPGLRAQIREHLHDRLFILRVVRFIRDRLAARRVLHLRVRLVRLRNFRRQLHPVLVADELEQLRRELRHRQHPVDHAGADRRHRHAVVLRFVRVLRDRQAALRADVFQPDHAIRVRARKNHADGALAVSHRQGAEEKVDRDALPEPLLRRHDVEHAVVKGELMTRRNHIDVVRLHLHRFRHLRHRHRGLLLNHARQLRLEVRREMHHHHEGEPAIGLHVAEELLQRRDAAGRRA